MTSNVVRYAELGGTEKSLQAYCLDRLKMLELQGLCYAFRSNSFSGRITRYDGSQGFVHNAKRGMPDIICCMQGTFVGIEVKSARGTQRTEQKTAQSDIERAGGKYFVVKCPEEFEDIVKQFCT